MLTAKAAENGLPISLPILFRLPSIHFYMTQITEKSKDGKEEGVKERSKEEKKERKEGTKDANIFSMLKL